MNSWRENFWVAVRRGSLLLAAYVAAGRLGLSLEPVSGFAAPVWPPTGIALAALLMWGGSYWPLVALGALLVNRLSGAPWSAAAAIGLGNGLEALVAVRLLGWRRDGLFFEKPQDVLRLLVRGAMLSTTVSASIGMVALLVAGVISAQVAPYVWSVWWVGDALGVLIVTPLILTWNSSSPLRSRHWAEALLLVSIMTGGLIYVFSSPRSAEHFGVSSSFLFPPLVWAALRFGPRGATAAVAVVVAAAVCGTAWGGGPFAVGSLSQGLLSLQIFMAVVSVTILLLASEVALRQRTEVAVNEARSELERRVGTRTAELARSNHILEEEVAQRRMADEEVRRLNEALEARVLERTWALEEVNSRLRGFLEEKETLLKEVHHRVKNNLQIVYSLINLQSRQVQDPRTLEGLRDCRERVRAMAMVHEKLYRSKDLGRIDFGEYVRELTKSLAQSYGMREIEVNVEAEGIRLKIDEAVPCGLMVHELVSNCFKHAFPGGRAGEVKVEVKRAGGGALRLEVGDNGVGLPQGADIRNTTSLGLQIIRMLSEQLGGRVDVEGEGGTRFVITFSPASATREKETVS